MLPRYSLALCVGMAPDIRIVVCLEILLETNMLILYSARPGYLVRGESNDVSSLSNKSNAPSSASDEKGLRRACRRPSWRLAKSLLDAPFYAETI
ncbi:hypothetical protein CVM73_35385 [Bradyrhizobium forestalis]|uniref:Uncharacterized protein n=1 Tax=Bradyrhizobium forestalis TaxID=1419263 RepID=A0A2M8QYF0_9BRAD|nr:hypothetical protein CVM73_35385 [Bradyrhizobium forestalis]